MKFIVTGGAGFIGHNVVNQLEQQGHTCIVIDNFTNYGFIPYAEIDYLKEERLKKIKAQVINADINDYHLVNHIFELNSDADAVIHLASFPRQKAVGKSPVVAGETMVPALINLLESSVKHGIEKFVYISSSMVYGDFNNDVTEEVKPNPQGLYGIMKLTGEEIVKDYHRRGLIDYTIIRPSAVYGEYDVEDRVVSKFMLSAMRKETLYVNGANEVLDFTYVEDAAQGIVLAATKQEANNEIFNITRSSSKLYTLKDAAILAVKIAGTNGHIDLRDRDLDFPSRGRLSIDKAINLLGYNPTVDVEEGFRRYHTWFMNSSYWNNND